MIKKFLNLSAMATLLLSVLLASVFVTGTGVKNYMAEKSARNSGALGEMVLTDSDFVMNSLRSRRPEKGWKATDGDPHLVFEQEMVLTGVEFYMEYNMYPGEMLLYYTTASQPEFTNSNMAVISPVKGRKGWFSADIPATAVTSIRIDPTVTAGNHMVYGDFIVNPEKTMADYLAPDSYSLLSLGIYTLVLFAVMGFVQDFFTKKTK